MLDEILSGLIGWMDGRRDLNTRRAANATEATAEELRKLRNEVQNLRAGALPTQLPPITIKRTCPFCAETIKHEARVCRFCGRDVPAPQKGKLTSTSVIQNPKVWYYHSEGQEEGPYSLQDMIDFFDAQVIGSDTLVRMAEEGDWQSFDSHPKIKIDRA